MRVLMLSKAVVVGAYQRKLEELADLGVNLTVAAPPEWRDERGVQAMERVHTRGYELVETPLAFNGNFHLHFYPRFGALLRRTQPDLVHIDEEPYNLATWLALRQAQRAGAKTLFFSWQNILRRYPPPFRWLERDVLARADGAIAGNAACAEVWRAKGYRGPLWIIPQFGVDPEFFSPHDHKGSDGVTGDEVTSPRHAVTPSPHPFTVGYAGRLVPEKGLDLLLLAAAQVPEVCVRIAGAGPERSLLKYLVKQHGLGERVHFEKMRPSTEMPQFYRQLDAFVLPSRTRPHWKEQFGRVLIEAMACGVPVIGSTCGEIPKVIGEAGLIFAEDDVEALAAHLRTLAAAPALRAALAEQGRARVLAHFTQRRIAEQTAVAYRQLLGNPVVT